METKDSIKIKIATEFTDSPGARDKSDGKFSGEEFFESLLKPRFEEAVQKKLKLIVDLDGVWGYPSSFISGSFGRLVNIHGYEKVFSNTEFISNDNKHRVVDFQKNSTVI